MSQDAMSVSQDAISQARAFVASAELPEPPPQRARAAARDVLDFDAEKPQAAVVGADIVAFARGVTPEQRAGVASASLLAQLIAKKRVGDPRTLAQVRQWYDEYFDTLSHVGFVIQDKSFAEYDAASDSFEAHEAILDVAAGLLVGAPAALALVKTTLDALKKASGNSPWITLFNRESKSANTAHFQVSLVEESADDHLVMALVAFGLEARSTLTQVLFFKFRTTDVTLEHHSGKVGINMETLGAVRDDIDERLVDYATDYIKGLPDL